MVSDGGKQCGGEVPTMVLSGTRGLIAFSGCPRGHRVYRETGSARSTLSAVTGLWILTLEPERRKNRKPSPEMNPVRKRLSSLRSSCLLFQMFSVETCSFLPNQQSDRGNLARQREARQVWLRSPSHASFVEILEGSAVCGSPGGRTLEDIFQIMVVVAVESAHGQGFLGAFELSRAATGKEASSLLEISLRSPAKLASGSLSSSSLVGIRQILPLPQNAQPEPKRCTRSASCSLIPK